MRYPRTAQPKAALQGQKERKKGMRSNIVNPHGQKNANSENK